MALHLFPPEPSTSVGTTPRPVAGVILGTLWDCVSGDKGSLWELMRVRARCFQADCASCLIWGGPHLGSPSPKPEASTICFPMWPNTQMGRHCSPEPQRGLSGGGAQGQPISSPDPGLVGLTSLSTCCAEMTDPFCVGGGRRLPGSTRSGPGKDGGRNEVRLPVLHDPPKLGKRGQAKVKSRRSQAASPGCGIPHWLPAPQWSSSWVLS